MHPVPTALAMQHERPPVDIFEFVAVNHGIGSLFIGVISREN